MSHNFPQVRMVQLIQRRHAGIVKILVTIWTIASAAQKGLYSRSKIGGGVKLKAPASGNHRVGAKIYPMVPPSLDTQFGDIFKTLASNAVSLEMMKRVMQRAVSGCPTVTLGIQGRRVPSLLDSASMVTLIWEWIFEKNILTLLKASSGELSEAHSLFICCQQQCNVSVEVFQG